jgi:hypothetical protein
VNIRYTFISALKYQIRIQESTHLESQHILKEKRINLSIYIHVSTLSFKQIWKGTPAFTLKPWIKAAKSDRLTKKKLAHLVYRISYTLGVTMCRMNNKICLNNNNMIASCYLNN